VPQATHLIHAPAQGVRIEMVVAAAQVVPVPRHRDRPLLEHGAAATLAVAAVK
jgi:hypothetical protein